MKPGIYKGLSFAEYCDIDAINHSRLCRIDKSPAHCKTAPDFSKSAAIRFGHLTHSGVLEPGSVAKRYAVLPAYEHDSANTTADGSPSHSTATKYVKASRAAFLQAASEAGQVVISQAEYDAYSGVIDAVMACPEAAATVNAALALDQTELSIVWEDTATGLLCKARFDAVTSDRLMDLKTSRDDGGKTLTDRFEQSLWTYSYYSQAAWYRAGWHTLTGDWLPFWFAVVSTDRPYQCITAPVGDMTLKAGDDINRYRMSVYDYCVRAGEWPGYTSPVLFEMPERYLEAV